MTQRERKLLVIEDSRSISDMLVHSLQQALDIHIVAAYSFNEAKRQLENSNDAFFLAIVDPSFPEYSKDEVIDYVLSTDTPCVVLSNEKDFENHDALLNKGVIDYINKDNLNEIQYIIDSAIRLYENFKRKVLVVDDSEVSLTVLSTLLAKMNLQVMEAKNGVEALEILKAHEDITLIVTDYNMPKMDGIELIYSVRKNFKRDEIAIIGISSSNDNKVSVQLLKAGANDFIARPFAYEEFNCRINQNIDAISNYKKLKAATITDFLTGLYNRKYVFEAGEKLFKNAVRSNIQLTVAMLDIDHFKKINDTFGHHVGDLSLKHISQLLTQSLRDGDILARMGGEEFCILCVNLSANNAESLFNRIRERIIDDTLIVENQAINITVSIGFTSELPATLDQMINHSDEALYEAKHSGRNKVCTYEKAVN